MGFGDYSLFQKLLLLSTFVETEIALRDNILTPTEKTKNKPLTKEVGKILKALKKIKDDSLTPAKKQAALKEVKNCLRLLEVKGEQGDVEIQIKLGDLSLSLSEMIEQRKLCRGE